MKNRSYLKRLRQKRWGWPVLTMVTAVMVAMPITLVGWAVLTPSVDVWRHLQQTLLGELVLNTLLMMAGVGLGTLILGTGLAWLVAVYRFPWRGVLEWMLILPMAVPGYVMAFIVVSLLNYTGPVQTNLRALLGNNIWFPEIRSGTGVFIVMSLVLYPYVYLLARSAFMEQGAALIDAARSLGHNQLGAFFRVVLPMARPSITVGVALALMEAVADIGAVSVLGFPTLSYGVYRVWLGLGEEKAALELAGLLLVFALSLLFMERRLRGRARYYQTSGRSLQAEPKVLKGWRGWAATAVCLLVVIFSFGIPFARLGSWAWGQIAISGIDTRYIEISTKTLILAGLTAALAVLLALIMAYGRRLYHGTAVRVSVQVGAMGYAVPGAVIGIGIIVAIGSAQAILDTFYGLISSGTAPLLSGSIIALIYAYLVRFMAVSYRPIEASLDKVTPSMDMASRSLGKTPSVTLWRIHVPIIGTGLITGAILVFVDVMKEMPATLLLRPIGEDTLATRVWQLTNESLWEAASLPALTIVLTGMIPVIFLIRVSRLNRYLFLSKSGKDTDEKKAA